MSEDVTQDHWIFNAVKPLNKTAQQQALDRQNMLTKPPGSLGTLETLAIKFAAWQGQLNPTINTIGVRVFAADHGVCVKGVSAFDQSVTRHMIKNFVSGGAAISVLSRSIGADFAVVNLGTVDLNAVNLNTVDADVGKPNIVNSDTRQSDNVHANNHYFIDAFIAAGTEDFSERPAMTSRQLCAALNTGKQQVENTAMDLFIGGEMGIGNTTSASALYSAILQLEADKTVGPGTGVDSKGIQLKQKVIDQALTLHRDKLHDPVATLMCLGGFEIAALCGAYIASAQKGVPVVVDGFISTAAALVAVKINPGVANWLIFSHCSAEPAHRLALEFFQAKPLVDFSMRLGEGSGAALVVPLLQAALSLHNEMATFTEAGIASDI